MPTQDEQRRKLRLAILNCQTCFPGNGEKCRHHEDILGGYAPGKIVFLGVNPQAGGQHAEFYKRLEEAPNDHKMLLGDHQLRIFAGQPAPPELPKELYENHPGQGWTRRLAGCLGLSERELADDVVSIELFKHTTADQKALTESPSWDAIQQNCPSWAEKQLVLLQPRCLVVSSAQGRDKVLKVLAFEQAGRADAIKNMRMRDLHGTVETAHFRGVAVEVLFTYAISLLNENKWKTHPRSADIREQLKAWTRGATGCAVPERQSTPAEKPLARVERSASLRGATGGLPYTLVESNHPTLAFGGVEHTGTRAEGYRTPKYLYRLPLDSDQLERIARAPLDGQGGRKYGDLERTWYISKSPSTYWPGVLPRLRAKLTSDGAPQPLSSEESRRIDEWLDAQR